MTKRQALDTLMLLSAIESWSSSTKERLPEYVYENLSEIIIILREIVLED